MKTLQTQTLAPVNGMRGSGPRESATNAKPAKLSPKEHGAYAILVIPLIAALTVGGVTVAGVCMSVAAIAGFFSHKPLLILWGHRGQCALHTTVRGVIASQKRQSKFIFWALLSILSVLVALGINGSFDLALATLPMLLMSWLLMLRPPSTKHLKRVGWSLVAATVLTAILVIMRSATDGSL